MSLSKKFRKKWLIAVSAALLLLLGYWSYGKIFGSKSGPSYVTAPARQGNLLVTVSGSGQVEAAHQLDLVAKASGDVWSVPVAEGQPVPAGTVLVSLDNTDAAKTVRDAETTLRQAQLDLEKIKRPLAPGAVATSVAGASAAANLEKSYVGAFNALAQLFRDLPVIVPYLNDSVFTDDTYTAGSARASYIDTYQKILAFYGSQVLPELSAKDAFLQLKAGYDPLVRDYKQISLTTSRPTLEDLLERSYDFNKRLAERTQLARDAVTGYQFAIADKKLTPPIPASLISDQADKLTTYSATLNTDLNTLIDARKNIADMKDALAGADISVANQELTVRQRENALMDARDKLTDYYVIAPFAGLAAKINVKVGDRASSGQVLATLLTSQMLANIELNEVDVARVKVGQAATLTFDALPDAKLTGTVESLDTLGTLNQGVVTYHAKIVFTDEAGLVKPGMSVTGTVTLEERQNVLLVSAAAVKHQGNADYVETLASGSTVPLRQSVTIGSANDQSVEIKNGLTAGTRVVVRTVAAGTAAPAPTGGNNSPFNSLLRGGSGGGGANRGR